MPFASDKLTMCVTGNVISYYKLEGNYLRHGRRTAPKFRTHVRIETRLALTYKQMTHPTPGGFRGLPIQWYTLCSSVHNFVR